MTHETEMMEQMAEVVEGRFFGIYRGTVRSNEDSTGRGRIEVVVPAVMGDEAVWALPCVPYAGPGQGLFALPDKDTNVWVGFEAGDPSYPVWFGCFWKDREIPEEDKSAKVKFIRTGKVTLRIDDEEGSIEISTSGGASVRITGTEIVLEAQTVTAKSGTRQMEVSANSFDVNQGAFSVV